MKTPQHPLEAAFNMGENDATIDIEQEYGMTETPNATFTPAVPQEPPIDVKDGDDLLVEKRIDEVYDAAMDAFQNQSAFIEVIDPKFAARNAEVAANYLNIALNAASTRAKVKTDRKRANQAFVPYNQPGKTTNNIVIADRNAILKMISVDDQEKKL
jgi:hypothetical protein